MLFLQRYTVQCSCRFSVENVTCSLKCSRIEILINTYYLYAFLIIASATIFRIVLSCLGWPATDSDEATYNLMALHIWKHGEHPIFMYGGNYLGPVEAYIGAVLFRIFGPSVLVMHIEIAGL